ncbi:hypothetical protein QMO14_30220 [Variovorax sp. CAN2819]|uniref:hypothetical protein n=1 Tax=Variovorax sp. CAN15 TaxID=3046727 RepID=UPI0026486A7F|nr:hypothetical protein [Variovorax sp. CAN15]MDN6887857.1 hypothetical protein [Variovorax sp. CAN15]
MQIDVPSLISHAFRRSAVDEAATGLDRLGIPRDSQLGSFFLRYGGSYASPNTGFELLALVGEKGQHSVESSTSLVRSRFGWPDRYLVLTNFLGGGVMAYYIATEQVFEVDFEGGDTLLKNGQLDARYPSFVEFLRFFFGEASATA